MPLESWCYRAELTRVCICRRPSWTPPSRTTSTVGPRYTRCKHTAQTHTQGFAVSRLVSMPVIKHISSLQTAVMLSLWLWRVCSEILSPAFSFIRTNDHMFSHIGLSGSKHLSAVSGWKQRLIFFRHTFTQLFSFHLFWVYLLISYECPACFPLRARATRMIS